MADLHKIIMLKKADFETMVAQGSVVINGITVTYDQNDLCFTDYITSEMVDDSNSSKKFLTSEQVTQLEKLPEASSVANLKLNKSSINTLNQRNLYEEANGTNINIDEVYLGTTFSSAPTADYERYSDGYYKLIRLSTEPTTKYNGYIYLINQT